MGTKFCKEKGYIMKKNTDELIEGDEEITDGTEDIKTEEEAKAAMKLLKGLSKAQKKAEYDDCGPIKIDKPQIIVTQVRIVGDCEYVGSNYSEAVREEVVNKQMGKEKTKMRGNRDIDAEVNGRRHIVNGVDCIPTISFLAAIMDTVKDGTLNTVKSTHIRRNISIFGEYGSYTPIKSSKEKNKLHPGPVVLESIVKLANSMSHVAFRPAYHDWSCDLTVRLLKGKFNVTDVMNLLDRAGITTGVGDNRKIGGGRFHVESIRDSEGKEINE